jgi:peptide/nickel transport system permease protein
MMTDRLTPTDKNKKRSRRSLALTLGSFLLFALILTAVFAPWIAPQDPNLMQLEKQFEAPSLAHPFGLDQNGSDVFSLVVYGARTSLFVGFTVVAISATLGLLIGSWAGWKGRIWDLALMRVIDLVHAFPGFLLALALVAVMGPSLGNLIFAMCLTGWTGYARLVRGEILSLKEREFVVGAVAIGASPWRILTRHLWPNLLGILAIQATFGIAGTVVAESGLSFLGLGVPPTVPTWGALINAGRRSLFQAPHVSLFPGLALFTLVLSLNLIASGLRDLVDPKRSDSL